MTFIPQIFGVDRSVVSVNFGENYVGSFEEVRCLIELGVCIEIGLILSCIDIKQKYPIGL